MRRAPARRARARATCAHRARARMRHEGAPRAHVARAHGPPARSPARPQAKRACAHARRARALSRHARARKPRARAARPQPRARELRAARANAAPARAWPANSRTRAPRAHLPPDRPAYARALMLSDHQFLIPPQVAGEGHDIRCAGGGGAPGAQTARSTTTSAPARGACNAWARSRADAWTTPAHHTRAESAPKNAGHASAEPTP